MLRKRLSASLAAATICVSTAANAAPPGAKPGDQEMTCAAIVAERAAIETDVARRTQAKAAGDRRKEGLMRFAKGAVSYAAPSVLGQLGGGSYMGSVAAQAAGQGAAQALNAPPAVQPAPAPAASLATPEQDARLDRLGKIAAYRQCAS